jgi:hypothetical protein
MSATATEAPEQAPATARPTPAKSAAADAPSKKKSSKEKGSKGSKSSEAQAASVDGPSVAAHPRAARTVALAKGWGGLGGFFIAGYLSLPTSTLAGAGLRALVAGSVCYVVAWAGAVFVWRRLVMIEIKGREQQLLASALGGEPPAVTVDGPGARASS